jgi:hypothetical protein
MYYVARPSKQRKDDGGCCSVCCGWYVSLIVSFVLLLAYFDVLTPLVVQDVAQGYFSRHVFAANRMDIWQLTLRVSGGCTFYT